LGYSGDDGQATNAMFGKAIAIALDAAGNIYFADGDNNRIRRVDASTRIITTVAGTGAASIVGTEGQAPTREYRSPPGSPSTLEVIAIFPVPGRAFGNSLRGTG
jgi:hypothetical protein